MLNRDKTWPLLLGGSEYYWASRYQDHLAHNDAYRHFHKNMQAMAATVYEESNIDEDTIVVPKVEVSMDEDIVVIPKVESDIGKGAVVVPRWRFKLRSLVSFCLCMA